MISGKIHPRLISEKIRSKPPRKTNKIAIFFAPCVFRICSRCLFAFMPMDLNFTNPNSTIFEKYRKNFSIFQTLPATMGTAAGEGGLSGRRRGFAAFRGRAFQRAGAAARGTTLQWPANMGTAARMLGGKKRLSRTVRREPAGSSGSAVRSPIQPVRFRLNLFTGQMAGPDRNGDRSTVGPAGPVRFLKHWYKLLSFSYPS